jgi:hypothetical protein
MENQGSVPPARSIAALQSYFDAIYVKKTGDDMTGKLRITQNAEANAFEVIFNATTTDAFNFYSNAVRTNGTLFNINDDNASSNASVMNISSDGSGAAFNIAAAGIALRTQTGSVILNENGGDFDTRIEGDSDQNLIFVDASTDRVGIGQNTPLSKLHITSSGTEIIRLDSSSGLNYNDINSADGKAIRIYPSTSYNTGPAFQFWPTGSAFQGMYFDAGSSSGTDIFFRGSPGGTTKVTFKQSTGQMILDGGVIFNEPGGDVDARFEGDTDTNLFFLDASTDRIGIGIAAPTEKLGVNGNLALETAGNGLQIKEGSNATMGTATLVAGTVTVNTNKVTASSRIFLSVQSLGTVAVATPIAVTARSAGTSFTITSSAITDTSVIAWVILEPA